MRILSSRSPGAAPAGRNRRRLRLAVVGALWAAALAGAGVAVIASRVPAPAPIASSSGSPGSGDITVLFVGNSFTTQNDMPLMVARLAEAAHEPRRLYVRTQAPGGARLADHAADGAVAALLAERHWDYVVLQEQSLVPGIPALRSLMLDPGRRLKRMIDANGAKTLLYVTWGYRDGDGPGDSFWNMEARTVAGYRALWQALPHALVVPAGPEFAAALTARPGIDLWEADGMHPNRTGSYLVACAFYRAIYRRSVVGNTYTAGLAAGTARLVQQFALGAQ